MNSNIDSLKNFPTIEECKSFLYDMVDRSNNPASTNLKEVEDKFAYFIEKENRQFCLAMAIIIFLNLQSKKNKKIQEQRKIDPLFLPVEAYFLAFLFAYFKKSMNFGIKETEAIFGFEFGKSKYAEIKEPIINNAFSIFSEYDSNKIKELSYHPFNAFEKINEMKNNPGQYNSFFMLDMLVFMAKTKELLHNSSDDIQEAELDEVESLSEKIKNTITNLNNPNLGLMTASDILSPYVL